ARQGDPISFLHRMPDYNAKHEEASLVSVNSVPDGYHTITPYLMVPDVSIEMEFLKRAFNAKQFDWNVAPDGTVAHASVKIGDSMLMMGAARGRIKRKRSLCTCTWKK